MNYEQRIEEKITEMEEKLQEEKGEIKQSISHTLYHLKQIKKRGKEKMTTNQTIEKLIRKLEQAKKAETEKDRKTKLKGAAVELELEITDKTYSDLLKEKLEKQEPSVTIEKLEKRLKHLEDSMQLWEEHSEEPYMGLYTKQGLEMMEYEISRFKKLKEEGHM